jgi:aspartyl-tRNA(Asn)/glutamyl-tRNA(Gln) amidotransferase subunit C
LSFIPLPNFLRRNGTVPGGRPEARWDSAWPPAPIQVVSGLASETKVELETFNLKLETLFMASAELDVKYVAHLARLALTPDEEKKLGAQLGNILGYIEKLRELDVSGVEPTAHAVPMVNVTRADEIRPSLPHEDALRNAPKQANGLFIVPKVVE